MIRACKVISTNEHEMGYTGMPVYVLATTCKFLLNTI